jgi:hypothetical protein
MDGKFMLRTTYIKDIQSLVENYAQKTTIKIDRGSFDHHDMHSSIDYRFLFFILQLQF